MDMSKFEDEHISYKNSVYKGFNLKNRSTPVLLKLVTDPDVNDSKLLNKKAFFGTTCV